MAIMAFTSVLSSAIGSLSKEDHMSHQFDVERLLEKRFQDMRHIETERHWVLGTYAVIIAGILAFLPQIPSNSNDFPAAEFAFGVLVILSITGLLHAWRAAIILHLIQVDVDEIVNKWQNDPTVSDFIWWIRQWQWPDRRGRHTWALWNFIPLPRQLTFVRISMLMYEIGLVVFIILLIKS